MARCQECGYSGGPPWRWFQMGVVVTFGEGGCTEEYVLCTDCYRKRFGPMEPDPTLMEMAEAMFGERG